jgi:hypothetical protein
MEVHWTYTEEGVLCHREASFKLETPRAMYKRNPKKELEENDKGGS